VHEFGVIETDPSNRILAFHEKNPDSPGIPGNPENVFASMGNYLFSTRTRLKALHEDAADEARSHDFGRDILPRMVGEQQAIYAYDFQTNKIPGEPPDMQVYWRDVGTTDAYREANMDLRAVKPLLNLYNRQWPPRTSSFPDPPARSRSTTRTAGARRAFPDKNVRVPEEATIGYDPAQDARLYPGGNRWAPAYASRVRRSNSRAVRGRNGDRSYFSFMIPRQSGFSWWVVTRQPGLGRAGPGSEPIAPGPRKRDILARDRRSHDRSIATLVIASAGRR
jgi:hypothetical protein